jgi:hypothetical protein
MEKKDKYSSHWFKHLIDAQYDPKIQALINKFGIESYGLYWILIEMLYKSESNSFNINLKDCINMKYFDEIVEYMVLLGLFYMDCDEIKSKRVDYIKTNWKTTKGKLSDAGIKSATVRKLKNNNKEK